MIPAGLNRSRNLLKQINVYAFNNNPMAAYKTLQPRESAILSLLLMSKSTNFFHTLLRMLIEKTYL